MAMKGRYNKETGEMEWFEVPDLSVKASNAGGNTGKDVRRFIRSCGYKPTAASVDLIQREVSRSEAQNAHVERIAKETGRDGPYDEKGKVTRERAHEAVMRKKDAQ